MDDLSSMHDPMRRAEGYRKVAAEYDDLANGAASAFFRAFFLQIAGQYREHADGGLPVMEEEWRAARQPTASPPSTKALASDRLGKTEILSRVWLFRGGQG